MNEEQKTKFVKTRLGENEFSELAKVAKEEGSNVGAYLRGIIRDRLNGTQQLTEIKEIKNLLADLSKQIENINRAGSGGEIQFNEAELLQKIQKRVRSEIIESEKVLAESLNKQLAQIEAQQLKNLNAQIDGLKTWLMQKFAG